MDSKLHEAALKRAATSEFEEQFVKSFRKVFGIVPQIDLIDEDDTVTAHGELWALDSHNWLLWYNDDRWRFATARLLVTDGVLDADL